MVLSNAQINVIKNRIVLLGDVMNDIVMFFIFYLIQINLIICLNLFGT